MWRILLSFLVIAAVTFLGPCSISRAAKSKQPNVLFIAVDDLNDWIGCLGGHPDCKSPNIDRLASRGLLFTRSYCAAPACNPSRVALMTGIRPSTSGVYVNSNPWRPVMRDVVTLPQQFMKHGYHVVGSGKIYHGRYEDPKSWHDYLRKKADPKPVAKILQDPRSRSGGIIWGTLDVKDSQMNDYKMVSYATKYLSQKHDKPFFLACGIFRPHMPWQVPRKYYDMYPRDKIAMPKVIANDLDDLPSAGQKMARPSGDHRQMLKTGNWRYAVQAYLASITFADTQIGRLLDALDASDYSENTIVILWGDHGWHLGEKEHWRKFALWEEATRCPLMIVAPGVTRPGTRCERTVDLMSVYPSLCELCDLPVGDNLDGLSFVKLLRDPQADWDTPALTTHGRNNHAIRTERYRYIRYADGGEELYDHKNDSMEATNLADKPELADVKKQLAAWLPKKNVPEAPRDRNTRRTTKNNKKKAKKKK